MLGIIGPNGAGKSTCFEATTSMVRRQGRVYPCQRAYVGPDFFETCFLILVLTAAVLPGKRVLLGSLVGTAIIITVLALCPRGLIGLWEAAPGLLRRTRQPESAETLQTQDMHLGDCRCP